MNEAKDGDEEDGGDGGQDKDEGLFTVVDADEARAIMDSRERQRRCRETTDPEQEAVNARMHISFVCRICDEVHYPDKPPRIVTNKRGKSRVTSRPIPDSCENMIPAVQSLRMGLTNERLVLSTGNEVRVPKVAEEFKTQPYENEDKCVALADINGYIKRKKESYLAIRAETMKSLLKMPFISAPSARIKLKMPEKDSHSCKHADTIVSVISTGKAGISESYVLENMFPITTVLQLGSKHTDILDMTDDYMMLLFHVESWMEMGNARKNEKGVYTETREELMANPDMKVFHEHYLLINTNPVNRDCTIYEVPETVCKIKDAAKLVDDGKARQVR